LLNNISLLWQQEKQAKNSAEIIRQASELHGRLNVFIRHFGALGALLNKTVESFNKSVGSFDDRVMPAARKVAALGDFDGELESIPSIDVSARDSRNLTAIEAVRDVDAS
jgi:DNA recombination protein RmuC